MRDKDAGSAHIDEIWARPRTTARAVQRGPAAQCFVLKRVLRRQALDLVSVSHEHLAYERRREEPVLDYAGSLGKPP